MLFSFSFRLPFLLVLSVLVLSVLSVCNGQTVNTNTTLNSCPPGQELRYPRRVEKASEQVKVKVRVRVNVAAAGVEVPIPTPTPTPTPVPPVPTPVPVAPTCMNCDAGQFRTASMSGCLSCPAGSFSEAGSSTCTLCAPGFYASQNGTAHSCQACAYSVAPFAGMTSCLTCPTGGVPDGNRTTCVKGEGYCPAHYYFETKLDPTLGGGCKACPEGSFYNSRNPGTTCVTCANGRYMSYTYVPGPSDLLSSPEESHLHVEGQTTQTETEPERTRQFPLAAKSPTIYCNLCPVGFYGYNLTGEDAWQCKPCGDVMDKDGGRRYFSNTTGATACMLCPVGEVSHRNGTGCFTPVRVTSGITCTAGTYYVSGSSMCADCLPGFYSNTTGATRCQPCPAGYIAVNGTSCQACPVNTYSFFPAATTCTNCSLNELAQAGSSRCYTTAEVKICYVQNNNTANNATQSGGSGNSSVIAPPSKPPIYTSPLPYSTRPHTGKMNRLATERSSLSPSANLTAIICPSNSSRVWNGGSVRLSMRVEVEYTLVSSNLTSFWRKFVRDLKLASPRLTEKRLKVLSIVAGSVIVSFEVAPTTNTSEPSTAAIAADIQSATTNSTSDFKLLGTFSPFVQTTSTNYVCDNGNVVSLNPDGSVPTTACQSSPVVGPGGDDSNNDKNNNNGSSSGSDTGLIVGLCVGLIGGALVIGGVTMLLSKKKNKVSPQVAQSPV